MRAVSPRQPRGSPSSQTQPSPSLRLSSPVVDWPESAIPPSMLSGHDSFLILLNAWALWALKKLSVRWHGPACTQLKEHPRAEARGPPGSPRAWASGKLLLPGSRRDRPGTPASGAAGQPQAVWLLPLEESPSSRHSSSSSRSGSNRPGNPVPPGPSGEPLPLGTTARSTIGLGGPWVKPTPEPTEAEPLASP